MSVSDMKEELDGACFSRGLSLTDPDTIAQTPDETASTNSINGTSSIRSRSTSISISTSTSTSTSTTNSKTDKDTQTCPAPPAVQSGCNTVPFVMPRYYNTDVLKEIKQAKLPSHYFVNTRDWESRPVKVKFADDWKPSTRGPIQYKMDANPRGYALLINNVNFPTLETRRGADNDEIRLKEFFRQCYIVVEDHRDKTMREMDTIVKNFSKKPELKTADCVFIVFMSHGDEDTNDEDSVIMGVDEMGLHVKQIISYFYHDHCPAMFEKPKIFLFQACRGQLHDFGVPHPSLEERTKTDGKKMTVKAETINHRTRTVSDVFIAHPVPPGRTANRDIYLGTWFTQALIDIFSQHACDVDLDDMIKMVDQEVKRMNTLSTNFQAVSTKTIGWDRKFYFNPGLFRIDGKTAYSENHPLYRRGTDMVDTVSRPKDKRKKNYSRLNDQHGDDDVKGCFTVNKCNTC